MMCRNEKPDTRQHPTACTQSSEENACVTPGVHTRCHRWCEAEKCKEPPRHVLRESIDSVINCSFTCRCRLC